jgi:phosphotriesterase-related protein
MSAVTVKGEVSSDSLGITLPHEHLLFDLRAWAPEVTEASQIALSESPVTMEILGELYRDPEINKDNLRQFDVNLAIQEALQFKYAGGSTIVDCTTIGLARDVKALKVISEATGLNIIAGAGFYLAQVHPKYVAEKSTEVLANQIIEEVQKGVGDTGIRCGIIGEIGTSWPLHPQEEKVLRAAAYAQQKTGAPLSVHPFPWGKYSHKLLDLLEEEGTDLTRVVMDHIDSCGFDAEYPASLAKRGCFVEFDTFGSEFYHDSYGTFEPTDRERVADVMELAKKGYVSQILLSHDLSFKIMLKKYGGQGYSHILKHIVPSLKRAGLADDNLKEILIDNPRKMLSFKRQ